jgi:integrase/recombinase XerD
LVLSLEIDRKSDGAETGTRSAVPVASSLFCFSLGVDMRAQDVNKCDTKSLQLSIEDLLGAYRRDLEAANRSPKTISWYMEILRRFFAFLDSKNLTKPVEDIGRDEVRTYIRYLQSVRKWSNSPYITASKGNLSPYSIQGHARSIKALWGWLFREEYILKNPLAKLPLPKVPQSLVKTLSIDQFRRLLAELDRYTPVGAKYYCILLFLLDTGVRISELVNIKVDDIDLVKCFARVVGKGRKERMVPFHKVTRKELQRYVNVFRLQLCSQGSPYLFPGTDRDHISVNSVQQFIRRLALKAGLRGMKCSPHIFRHSFSTAFIAKGGTDFALMAILGHTSLQPTQKYIHLQPQDLQRQHARFTPLEDLFPGQH